MHRRSILLKADVKIDWSECYRLHELWWNQQAEQGMVADLSNRTLETSPNEPLIPTDPRQWWTDAENALDRAEYAMDSTLYRGAAFPHYSACLGPGSLALFLGCEPVFSEGTVWYKPCLENITDSSIELDPDNYWYKWTEQALHAAMERSQGRYLVSMPDLIEGLDCAAELLGNEKLLFAMVEQPEAVHRLLREITDCYIEVFDRFYNIISPTDNGNSVFYFEILGSGKTGKFQSDISAMLSPAMFDEFVLPYLEEHTRKVRWSLYHLDGPSALVHLDSVLSIETLNAVQWVPGDGSAPVWDRCWKPTFEKILNANKGLQVILPREHLNDFLDIVKCGGVYAVAF